jgi:hypothetical protein
MRSKRLEPWEILPYERLGPFRLASSREENRNDFGEFRAIDRSDKERRDGYLGIAAFVNYDQNDLAEFIEVASPARPVFRGVEFMGRNIESVLDDMADLGCQERWNDLDNAILYDEIGLLVSVSPSDKASGVAIYKRGYWQEDTTGDAPHVDEHFA